MPSNKRKLVRARMEKTNESYATAERFVRAKAAAPADEVHTVANLPPSEASATRLLETLLEVLKVSSAFVVETGRGRPNHREAIRPPLGWRAESGAVSMQVSEEEHHILVSGGAVNGKEEQVIRSYVPSYGDTFSAPCDRCGRYIWCGKEERSASCVCGRKYRVTFDLPKVLHGTLKRNIRCMTCGDEHAATTPPENKNPWRGPNPPWQWECNECDHMPRSFVVHLDYETSEHAGAGGMFQVMSLEERGVEVVGLVDPGIHFPSLDALRGHLRDAVKKEVELIEV